MFGIGMPELMVIFVIALLVFGPKELPKIGKTIGKAMAEFRRASDELKEGIQREIELAEREQGDGSSTPSPEAAIATVPTESPNAAPPLPEPQLELPMAAVPGATPELLGTTDPSPAIATMEAAGPAGLETPGASEPPVEPVAEKTSDAAAPTTAAAPAPAAPGAAPPTASAQPSETKHVG